MGRGKEKATFCAFMIPRDASMNSTNSTHLPLNPLVTVAITTYNAEENIGSCLSSIFEQTYPAELFEVIMVDAGSKDNTLRIAEEYPVKVFVEEGCTRGRGRNLCLEKARGEIVVMIDSDNIAPSDWVERLVKYFEDPKVAHASIYHRTMEPRSGLMNLVLYYLRWT